MKPVMTFHANAPVFTAVRPAPGEGAGQTTDQCQRNATKGLNAVDSLRFRGIRRRRRIVSRTRKRRMSSRRRLRVRLTSIGKGARMRTQITWAVGFLLV